MKDLSIRFLRAGLALTLLGAASGVLATPMCCNCNSGGPTRLIANEKMQTRDALDRLAPGGHASKTLPAPSLDDPTAFYGDIAGKWDDVDGYFSLPYSVAEEGELNILLRGFPARSVGGDRYAVEGWDRSVYWLDVGDGTPRLLQALELARDYVPEEDDYFFDSEAVASTCSVGAGCTLNLVPYLRYQEFGADYTDRGAEENGVVFDEIQLAFVTDGEGDAIDAAVLFDEEEVPEAIQPFELGDKILLATLAYKIDEPEYIYALGYMEAFAPLELDAGISRANYIPGTDFVDPELPADLDAGNRPVRLILDASSGRGDGYGTGGTRPPGAFSYAGPFALGFVWKNAQSFVYRDGFEALVPVGATSKLGRPARSLVRRGGE
jgi:hypothetical protein